ncbi:MAG: hypothetical protein KAR17_05650, partial [Cyclobacteriaceae bacterium]|nr:hypothetical protein [Cyclobacteriaceae bacterium]
VYEENEGSLKMILDKKGKYYLSLSNGQTKVIEQNDQLPVIQLDGDWEVSFPENWDAPLTTVFSKLISWHEHDDEGIKHFSGTGTYEKTIVMQEEYMDSNHTYKLDLGEVNVMAKVKMNGKNLGILWKQPYEVDITQAIQAGNNQLEIEVTNLWWNRLVGDEKYPNGFPNSDSESSFGKRRTYLAEKVVSANEDLLPSGLLGPVSIEVAKKINVPLN